MICNPTRSKEIKCAPYGTANGPSTPECDKFFRNQCAHFRAFTGGLGSQSAKKGACGCFNENIGEQYICPKVGEPGPAGSACKDCHHLRPNNLGEHYICDGSLTEAGLGATMNPRITPSKGCGQEGEGQKGEGQKGGGPNPNTTLEASTFYRPIYNSCDGKIIRHKRNPYLGPMDYNLARYADCAGSPVKVRTSYLPSAQCGRDYSTVVEQHPVSGVRIGDGETQLMCNGRERCGNGLCSRPLCSNNQGVKGQNCCKKFALATSCYRGDARSRCSPWVYGCDDIPSYSLDLSGPIIGGRPQWRRGTNNSVPPMMLQNTVNLPGRNFDCRQPCWGPDCV